MQDDDDSGGSPACFLHQLVDGQPVDPQTRTDVARFRKAERARLIAARLAVPVAEREAAAAEVAAELDALARPGQVVALYWPFRGELDLRPWARAARARGIGTALPVVLEKGAPLVFRHWREGSRLERGVWNIPIPAEDDRVVPDLVIAPLVGVDPQRFRLGYGGGFYDRTLAALSPRPAVIGVAHRVARVATIFPQPWDIPMDRVILAPPDRATGSASAPRPAPR